MNIPECAKNDFYIFADIWPFNQETALTVTRIRSNFFTKIWSLNRSRLCVKMELRKTIGTGRRGQTDEIQHLMRRPWAGRMIISAGKNQCTIDNIRMSVVLLIFTAQSSGYWSQCQWNIANYSTNNFNEVTNRRRRLLMLRDNTGCYGNGHAPAGDEREWVGNWTGTLVACCTTCHLSLSLSLSTEKPLRQHRQAAGVTSK